MGRLRPRQWHAGGLPRGLEMCTGTVLPEVAPLDIVRGVVCSVRSLRNNVKDGTPGGGHIPACSELLRSTKVLAPASSRAMVAADAGLKDKQGCLSLQYPLRQFRGWSNRHVIARTSSKRSSASVARWRSTEFDRASSRMWVSTSLADA